jgi:periplasmic divalent cation tolerance protein
MDDIVILYTTWPDLETAQAAGTAAVQDRLAACVNVLAPMTSIYRWKGAMERQMEIPMLLKTALAGAGRLRDFILSRHPHDTPCVLALKVDAAGSNPAFLCWIAQEIA